ncbi:DMT family transporter [Leptolyngbya cf. ectocarpi LEGE 11479]|uniref:DMT family transporter n=1 Tax=Leptolyngbya cf. ectocarpi LEGE 11479 TaxID=1828722 RepID=A0A929A009_LEPEC|nr:DMT family transporter [Leptolyngbya ectocarpi]MBE9070526.1 DMT family transporter [Leptolyngbya cf. ectocarpi LEGE 11479]
MNEQSFVSGIDPKFMLVLSRALQALRPSLIAFLVANAETLSGGMKTPISFCNVLFVGNLCAALVVLAWFGAGPIFQDLRQMPRRILLGLLINGCLAALLSGLIFVGLEHTMVTNSVLLGRLGPILFALAGAIIWGKHISKAEWVGFSLIMVGILAIVFISSQFQINRGDLFILASTLVYAIASIISKFMLSKDTPLRTVVFARNFVSAIVFFGIANILFGPDHFAETFAGQLWIVMAIYALVLIVVAQFLWYAALGRLDSRVVGRWTSLTPVFAVFYAFVLNGERPSMIQVLAFAIIMLGVWVSTLGKRMSPMEKDHAMEMETMAASNESAASAT